MRTQMVYGPVKALGLPWNNWTYTGKDHLRITVREKRHVTMWLAVFGETVEVQAGGPPENFVVASAVWDADAVRITLEAAPPERAGALDGKRVGIVSSGIAPRHGIVTSHVINRGDVNGAPGLTTETITIDLEPAS